MIPPLKYFNKPILELFSDKKVWTKGNLTENLAKKLDLTKKDLLEYTKGGSITKFSDRISWALVYLKKAGMIESKGAGMYVITKTGLNLLNKKQNFEYIDNNILSYYSEDFDKFQNSWRKRSYKGVRKK